MLIPIYTIIIIVIIYFLDMYNKNFEIENATLCIVISLLVVKTGSSRYSKRSFQDIEDCNLTF